MSELTWLLLGHCESHTVNAIRHLITVVLDTQSLGSVDWHQVRTHCNRKNFSAENPYTVKVLAQQEGRKHHMHIIYPSSGLSIRRVLSGTL